jgi:hypothetical protein
MPEKCVVTEFTTAVFDPVAPRVTASPVESVKVRLEWVVAPESLPVKVAAEPSVEKATVLVPPAVKLVKPERVWLAAETVKVPVVPVNESEEFVFSVTTTVEGPVIVPLMPVKVVPPYAPAPTAVSERPEEPDTVRLEWVVAPESLPVKVTGVELSLVNATVPVTPLAS